MFLKISCFSLIVSLVSCRSTIPKKPYLTNLHLVADSGFLLRKDAVQLLIYLNRKICSKEIDFNNNPSSDTIAKYYKKNKSKNYILCLQNYFKGVNGSDFFLLEINQKGKIVKENSYSIGFYNCFSGTDNFIKKNKDYFTYSTFGTGSAFCAEEIYFFKEITSQNSMNSIATKVFRGGMNEENSIYINSILRFEKNKIVVDYTKKYINSQNQEEIKLQEKFSINYYWKKKHWLCFDSLRLNKISF